MVTRTLLHPVAPRGALAALLSLALVACGGDDPVPAAGGPTSTQGKPLPPRTWSSHEIATDPEGYLAWADNQVASQVKARQEFLTKLTRRQVEVRERQRTAGADLGELENFLGRLKTAVQRAEDEDRWPVQVGAKRYERDRALELLATLPKQIELRKPLALEYDAALKAMDAKAAKVNSEIADLGRLREKLALDLERVRLNVGAAELEKLGTTAAEIEHFAKILGQIHEEAARGEPAAGPSQSGLIPLDALLK
jgi:hypothetical protein